MLLNKLTKFKWVGVIILLLAHLVPLQAQQLSCTAIGHSTYCGNSLGAAGVTPYGGSAPYAFLWNTGATAKDVFSLTPGVYTVTVTDIAGASTTCSVSIVDQTPACNMSPTCDNKGNITIEVLNPTTCECVTRTVTKPVCAYGERYSTDMCMCVKDDCYKVCDATPVCNGDGWLYNQVLNPETCECETKALSTPACAQGEIYDKATCKCIPDCTLNCYGEEWCENGYLYKKVLDPYQCECITQEVGTISCPYGEIYDLNTCSCVPPPCTITCAERQWCENGHTYKTVFDKDNCDCRTEKIAAPVCGTGKIYDATTCGCIPKPCTITCYEKEWCSSGKVYKQVKDPISCQCVTTVVANPTCPTGQVYDAYKCSCVPEPCKKYCQEKEWCENGTLYKQTLDHQQCECVTLQVTPNCRQGEVYDPATCGCKLAYTPASCDKIRITASNNEIIIDPLTAPLRVVRVLDAHWQVVYQCMGNCNETEIIPAFEGTYYVSVELYTASWQRICRKDTYVTVGGIALPDGKATPLESYDCGWVKVSYGSGTIHLQGMGEEDYIFRVYKRLGGWQEILNCGYKCGKEAKLENLPDGSYYIEVFSNSGARACKARTIDLKGNNLTDSSSKSRTGSSNIQLEVDNQQHAVYPNPATQELFVDVAAYAGQKGMVKLVNAFGQVIQQLDFDELPTSTIRLDLDRAEAGLHFLTIVLDTEEVITDKILINK